MHRGERVPGRLLLMCQATLGGIAHPVHPHRVLVAEKETFAQYTPLTYILGVLTVVETPTFAKQADQYWKQSEREEFIAWIARNHDSGDVIPSSGGCRKIRWGLKDRGKSGGVRVIYYNMLADGRLVLLLVYGKNVTESIPGSTLKIIQEKIHASFNK